MDWPIKIDFSRDYLLDASLSLHEVDNEIMLEFVNPLSTETLLVDRLLSFDTIEFDDLNPLHVRFRGASSERRFRFVSEDAIATMWMIFQKYVELVSLPGKSKSFRIISLNKRKPEVKTPIKEVKTKALPREKSIPEAISSGLLRESVSGLHFRDVTEANIDSLYVDNSWQIRLYEINVVDGFQFDLWKRLLRISVSDKDTTNYRIACNLWRNVLPCQLERHSCMRDFMKSLNHELSTHVKNTQLRKLSYEVLMSFFMARYSNTFVYRRSFTDLLDFLMKMMIACTDGDSFCCRNGDKLSFEETSVHLFTVFSKCYDLIMDTSGKFCRMPDLDTLFADTLEVLTERSPTTADLLKSYGIEGFNALQPFIESFFMISRSDEDSVLIFTAILSMTQIDLRGFMKCFIASTLILLHTRLENSHIDGPRAFTEMYLSLVSTVNVRLLLFNVDQLMELYSLD